MLNLSGKPKANGYRMPGEFEPHQGTIMIWPIRLGSWPYEAKAAKNVFSQIACTIAEGEELYMLTDCAHLLEAQNMLYQFAQVKETQLAKKCIENIHVLEIDSDDAWARDVGPTYVVSSEGKLAGINWSFNAWGGAIDGLYQNWEKDNALARKFLEKTNVPYYNAEPFVLEGGAIHSDGEGTVIVTEACLLSEGRNPHKTKTEIETVLKAYLGAEKIIWLPRGIFNDETNEHVDNICAYIRPAEVVLAWTENINDPQYAYSRQCMDVLEKEKDAQGRRFIVHKMNIPDVPVCITQEEVDGFVFEEDEDIREAGERLAASYVNFYIANETVLVPQFGDVQDANATALLTDLFPDRRVVPIYARDIIVGGGNIHCITQQIPRCGKNINDVR